MCGNFFRINGSQYILKFGDNVIVKVVLQNKSINKTRTKKDQKSSAHWFCLVYV